MVKPPIISKIDETTKGRIKIKYSHSKPEWLSHRIKVVNNNPWIKRVIPQISHHWYFLLNLCKFRSNVRSLVEVIFAMISTSIDLIYRDHLSWPDFLGWILLHKWYLRLLKAIPSWTTIAAFFYILSFLDQISDPRSLLPFYFPNIFIGLAWVNVCLCL